MFDPAARCLIVAGPTASGKSALALALAEGLRGTVINADAMQCYRELRILTARPSPEEEARVPHRLYGTRPAAQPGTAASWRAEALATIAEAHADGRLPILCGGTFLYMAALTRGLADIPEPPGWARTEARALLASEGPAALHARLATADPATAATLRPSDSQRLARAWEVWRGTGAGLADWQARPGLPAAALQFAAVVLRPERAWLRARIERRLAGMVASGVLDEVRALLSLGLDPTLPAMRAHGVPEFARHLAGALGLAEACAQAATATVRYTRRQETWLRHRPPVDEPRMLTIDTTEASCAQLMELQTRVHGIFLTNMG